MPETTDIPFPIEIISNARRKRIAIRIWEGRVQLLTPKYFSENTARDFLNTHMQWVQKKLAEYSRTPYHPKQYTDDEPFLYLGNPYLLKVAFSKQPMVMMRENQLFVFIRETTCPQKRKQQIYRQLRAWYYQEADRIFNEKTNEYAQKLGVQYQSVSIRQWKSRWGSCSIRGDIQYAWQVVMAPIDIVSYLVVHELSHIKHHNHSPKFWAVVASMIPDYRTCQQWLKTQGHLLKIT